MKKIKAIGQSTIWCISSQYIFTFKSSDWTYSYKYCQI